MKCCFKLFKSTFCGLLVSAVCVLTCTSLCTFLTGRFPLQHSWLRLDRGWLHSGGPEIGDVTSGALSLHRRARLLTASVWCRQRGESADCAALSDRSSIRSIARLSPSSSSCSCWAWGTLTAALPHMKPREEEDFWSCWTPLRCSVSDGEMCFSTVGTHSTQFTN